MSTNKVALFLHKNKHLKQNEPKIHINLLWKCGSALLKVWIKGVVGWRSNWPKYSFVKHLPVLRHVHAGCLSARTRLNLNLRPRSSIHHQNLKFVMLYKMNDLWIRIKLFSVLPWRKQTLHCIVPLHCEYNEPAGSGLTYHSVWSWTGVWTFSASLC